MDNYPDWFSYREHIDPPMPPNFTGYNAMRYRDSTIHMGEDWFATFDEATTYCEGLGGTIFQYDNGIKSGQWWIKKGDTWHDVTGQKMVDITKL